MNSEHTQGLGGSVAIYLVALACGLSLFVLPVLFASGQKYDNAGMAAYDPPPGTLLIPQRARNAVPLALLKHDDLVDSALAAEMNAKSKKTEKPHHLARPKAPAADMRYAQPVNNGRPFLSLF
jgi:hypothetical protein